MITLQQHNSSGSGKVGPKGDKGDLGYTPVKGVDYFDGAKGDTGPASSDATVTKAKIQCKRTDGGATAGYQDANGTRFNIKEL